MVFSKLLTGCTVVSSGIDLSTAISD